MGARVHERLLSRHKSHLGFAFAVKSIKLLLMMHEEYDHYCWAASYHMTALNGLSVNGGGFMRFWRV